MHLTELNKKIVEYESVQSRMTSEIQRLNMVIKAKVDEVNEYDLTLKRSNSEIQESRRRLHEVEE